VLGWGIGGLGGWGDGEMGGGQWVSESEGRKGRRIEGEKVRNKKMKKNYKLQNTNYKQIPNPKLQITKKRGTLKPTHTTTHPCSHAAMQS
jgi:hypothetical protein